MGFIEEFDAAWEGVKKDIPDTAVNKAFELLGEAIDYSSQKAEDYGIMEKADNVYIMPSSFGWSDLGTWASAFQNLEKDYLENAVVGDNVMIIDATNNLVHASNKKLILLQGLNDYVVVDTKDVLLICKKDKEQEIKEYVAEIKRNKGDKYL